MFNLIKYIFILLLFSSTAFADEIFDFAYSDKWLKLLHYHKTLNNYKGLIRTDNFYLDKNGRYNPLKELETEITVFMQSHEKCRFPARFNLLKEHGFVSGDLNDCAEYQKFMQDIQPNGVTLLFTDAYMSNPASLFGHTLVRIDTARKGTQMLAHGSNFGADSGNETGLPFILKGLFGGYDGKYNLSPYWTVINTYNNIENRDIWEYKLNLTSDEQQKFINHLYEMKDAQIQYFFLTKNCSYMILELLEAVRPNLNLSKDYNYWAIPLDTLKTVRTVPNLIGEINYRPARYTKIKYNLNIMNNAQYNAFIRGIKEQKYEMPELNQIEQQQVLDSIYQYYQYKYTAGKIELKDYRRNSFAVLRRRSTLPPAEEIKPKGFDPSLSHGSFQITFGGGIYNHQSFEQINIRPAYTGLTDDNKGLIRGAGVKVAETVWRLFNQKHKLVLQNLTGLNIYSLVPADNVFMPYSYKTDLSLKREYNPQTKKEGYVGNTNFGLGATMGVIDHFWLYGLLNIKSQYGGFIPDNYWFGLAPEFGIFADISLFRWHIAAEKTFATSHFGDRLKYKSEISIGLTDNLSFNFEYSYSNNKHGHNLEEWLTSFKISF